MDQRKNQPVPPESIWQEEGFEFELTDIDEARRILDTESISQFDVATIVSPDHWKKLRRPKVASDRALTGVAIDWLTALPAALRPHVLSREFPRIVNSLAEVWDDPEQCQAAFQGLLCSGRKGRQGFSDAVRDELVALQDWTQLF